VSLCGAPPVLRVRIGLIEQGDDSALGGNAVTETTTPGSSEEIERIDLNPEAGFAFSSCVIAGDYIHTSHHAGYDVDEGHWPGTVEAQTEKCLDSLETTLQAAGATLADVVKTTVLLRNSGDFPKMNHVYKRRLANGYPARTTVMTEFLDWECLVQIDAVAYRPR
jgi:2-iminobutanoate/2-iminopropanoate deaminase